MYAIDKDTGLLTLIEEIIKKNENNYYTWKIYTPCISPDSRYLYFASSTNKTFYIYQRNIQTGTYEYFHEIPFNENEFASMMGVSRIAISQDGKNMYITSISNNSIYVLNRDISTSKLELIQTLNKENTTEFINNPGYIFMSPDSRFVYAANHDFDSEIAVLSRNLIDGKLTNIQTIKDSEFKIENLRNISHIGFRPDSRLLFVTSYEDHTLSIFKRNEETGKISLVDQIDEEDGVKGLRGLHYITFDSDFKVAYCAASIDGAIMSFDITGDFGVPMGPANNTSIHHVGYDTEKDENFATSYDIERIEIYSLSGQLLGRNFVTHQIACNTSELNTLGKQSIKRLNLSKQICIVLFINNNNRIILKMKMGSEF